MLKWRDLNKIIQLNDWVEPKSDSPDTLYSHMLFVWKNTVISNQECLYIVPAKMLNELHCCDGVSLIVVTESKQSITILPDCIANCLLCTQDEAERLYDRLAHSFALQNQYRKLADELSAMANSSNMLKEMCVLFSQHIGRPVVIIDNTLRFIAVSSQEELDNMVPEFDRSEVGVTPERLRLLKKDGILERGFPADISERIIVGNLTIQSIPLRVNQVNSAILGFAGVVGSDTDNLPLELIYELPHFAEIFSAALSKRDSYLLNKSSYFHFIMSMILENGNTADIEDIRSRLRVFHYDLKEQMYLLIVKHDRNANEDAQITALAEMLKKLFTNSIYLIRQQDILFLVTRSSETGISDYELANWEGQLSFNHLHVGMTGPFTDFHGFNEIRMKEASLALNAGLLCQPKQNLHRFQDIQTDAMLYDLANHTNLALYLFQPLMHVIEYDNAKRSNLLETLRVYLKNYQQPQAVCQALFIHKNTLYKRLNKIREIMDCDFMDAEIMMKINLTFHILDSNYFKR